jgi:DNA-binding CsgD family transcriptional regulator
MLRGHTEQARALLERSGAREPRDEMLAAGLAVGLARRDGTGLDAQWSRARTALVGHPVDLYTLLPLGECAVAAAQLGAQDRLAVHLAQAHALLARLGTPGAWSAPLRWALLHAALATDDVAGAREHAAALAGGDGPYAAALAVAAGVWCDLAAGTVDAAAVQEAGRGLHDVGLGGEGARLVGSAAASTADRRRMAELHACARELHPPSAPREAPSEPLVPPDAPATVIPAPRSPRPDDDLQLTDRELEIGGLILAGLTYRQIGARLFLSEKTVEHHVGRIRRRLGVGSRKELFGRLRALLPAQS